MSQTPSLLAVCNGQGGERETCKVLAFSKDIFQSNYHDKPDDALARAIDWTEGMKIIEISLSGVAGSAHMVGVLASMRPRLHSPV